MKTGIELIADERARQVSVEGWTAGHDAEVHFEGTLALAGAVYAQDYALAKMRPTWPVRTGVPVDWPWCPSWWKPSPLDPVKQLAKAGALIAAEMDRLLGVGGAASAAAKMFGVEVVEVSGLPEGCAGVMVSHDASGAPRVEAVVKWGNATEQAKACTPNSATEPTEVGTPTPLAGVFKVGDFVEPARRGVELRSGCSSYGAAVVASLEPFVLISQWGDMRWSATVKREDFKVCGPPADEETWQRVVDRMARDAS